jgi:hypothetical protein
MIPQHPNDFLAVRDLLNKVQDLLVRLLQFRIRVVDNVAITTRYPSSPRMKHENNKKDHPYSSNDREHSGALYFHLPRYMVYLDRK